MDENPIYESQYTIQQIEDSIGKSPIIDPDTKEWKVWDIGTSAYVGTGIIAESETYAEAAAASAQVAQDYADNIADPVGGIVAQWIADNLSQETGYVIDTSLTVQGAAADAKTVGDKLSGALTYRGVANSSMDLNSSTFTVGGQWYCSSGNYPLNFPFTSGAGRIVTLGSNNNVGGKIMLAFSANGDAAFRYRTASTWYNWRYLINSSTFANYLDSTMTDSSKAANAAAVGDLAPLGYPTMITTTAQLEALVPSKSANDLPINRMVSIGSNSVAITDGVTICGSKAGLYLTINYKGSATSGAKQIFLSRYGVAVRSNSGGAWSKWLISMPETTYYIGPARDIKSLTELWMTIGNDATPKVVYVDAGEYDVFQEYLDNNVPVPPDGTSTNNYKDYCANIPSNTRIVGVGEVVLRWEPTASQISETESNIWSVVNVHGENVELENLTIVCKNVRYAVHDDPHNAFPGCRHVYKNIRVHRLADDPGLGRSLAFGMGYCDKGIYSFKNLWVSNEDTQGNGYCIGGHEGNTGSSAGAFDGATVSILNSVFLAVNDYSARFQTINATGATQRIQVLFASCWLNKKVWLDKNAADSGQFFDLTLLRSGNPDVQVDIDVNPYPVKIYDSEFVPLSITTQPQSVSVSVGSTAYFTVGAVGNGVKYQWQYSDNGGTTWLNTSLVGNKTERLTVPATAGRNGFLYRCMVGASTGESAVSDAATLTVT